MADNVWSGFVDNGPEQPRSPAVGGGIWGGFSDEGPNSSAPESKVAAGWQYPLGVNRGLAAIAGAPVDLTTAVLNHYGGKINKIGEALGGPKGMIPPIKDPIGGAESIKRGMGMVGVHNPDDYPAETTLERTLSAAGEGTAALLAPEVAGITRGIKTGGDLVKMGTIGAAGGAGGEAAAEVVPEPYKPTARIMGTLLTGGAAGIAAEGPKAVGQIAGAAKKAAEPLTVAGRDTAAARKLSEAATSPRSAIEQLETAPRELVPGSHPTTFQASGDMGLGQVEREAMTRNPDEFNTRRTDQNAARVRALESVAPAGAQPADVSNHLRSELARIDTATNAAVEGAANTARSRAAAIGGNEPPEAYGGELRGILQEHETAARDAERRLWRAVDPQGDLTVPANPVKAAIANVYGNLSQAAQATLGPAERQILGVIGQYGNIVPFRELSDLRSVVSGEMRAELISKGRTPTYARLSQLRGGLEEALSGMVEQRATQEAQAVAAGQMPSEATMAARLQADADAFRAQRRAGVAEQGGGAAPPAGGSGAPGVSGAAGAGQGRPGMPPGGAGGTEQPTFDAAASERLSAATAATRERAQTFGASPNREILRSQGAQGQYRLPDAAVAGKVFQPGPRGFDTVQAYVRAAGGSGQAATQAVSDFAAMSLRRAAMRPDGVLDPQRFASWQRAYQDALRALPNRADFADAARATEAITTAAETRSLAMRDFQSGTVARLLNVSDPQDIVKTIGGILGTKTAVRDMAQIANRVRSNSDAWQGLRRSVTDFIYNKMMSTAEAGTSGATQIKGDTFQKYIRDNRAALHTVLSEEEISTMGAVAADIQRANRSIVASKLPGQSNTAQDTKGALEKIKDAGAHASVLTQMLLAAYAGFEVHGVKGALIGASGVIGSQGINAMRAAGMKKIDDLVKDAMLDPDLALRLLKKAPAGPNSAPSMALLQRLARLPTVFAIPHQEK